MLRTDDHVKRKMAKKKSKWTTFSFANRNHVFGLFLVVRLVNALLIRTAFVPDEIWQAVEVAHRWVFGYVPAFYLFNQSAATAV